MSLQVATGSFRCAWAEAVGRKLHPLIILLPCACAEAHGGAGKAGGFMERGNPDPGPGKATPYPPTTTRPARCTPPLEIKTILIGN